MFFFGGLVCDGEVGVVGIGCCCCVWGGVGMGAGY